MVTDGKPVMARQIIGGIVLPIQHQRTLMLASAFTHITQANAGINYCFHRSMKIFQEWKITVKILFIHMYELDDFRRQFILGERENRLPWGQARENLTVACKQQRQQRPACATTQFDMRICCSLTLKFEYLKGTPALMIRVFYQKKLFEP